MCSGPFFFSPARHLLVPSLRAFVLVCFTLGLVFTINKAQGASFDCRGAKTDVEKLICSDKELSDLDATLAQTYRQMRVSVRDPEKIIMDQKRWLKSVRNNCTSVACLISAYQERIRVLNGTVASFDCGIASSRIEKMICSDDQLRYGDRILAQAYLSLRDAGGNQNKIVAEQKEWLERVRDKCTNIKCLQTVFYERVNELMKRREDLIALTKEQIGHIKNVIYSDLSLWPKDASRTIVIFATQKSMTENPDSGPQPDEDFDVDVYVLDTATHKVLQHATDSVSSDAISFEGFSIDKTDYSTRLRAQAFGISLSHTHRGCAGYDGNSIRLYAVNGKKLKTILPGIAIESSHGMCGTDCEYGTTQRKLEFAAQTGRTYPDLIVQEKKAEAEDDPKAEKGTCKTIISSKRYILHFNGTQYAVPEELAY